MFYWDELQVVSEIDVREKNSRYWQLARMLVSMVNCRLVKQEFEDHRR